MNDLQVKKMAKLLKVSVGTIRHYYENSTMLRDFYQGILQKKNW